MVPYSSAIMHLIELTPTYAGCHTRLSVGNRHLLGVVGFQSRFTVTSYSPAFKCSTSKKMVSTGISSSTGMGVRHILSKTIAGRTTKRLGRCGGERGSAIGGIGRSDVMAPPDGWELSKIAGKVGKRGCRRRARTENLYPRIIDIQPLSSFQPDTHIT